MKFTYRGSKYNYSPTVEPLRKEVKNERFTYRGITYNYSPLKDTQNVTALTIHILFVTEKRHPIINPELEKRLKELTSRICIKRNCSLLKCQADLGKPDHIHLIIDKSPNVTESDLAMLLKTTTDREIKREFAQYLKSYYPRPTLWQRGYCIVSGGGSNLHKLTEYLSQ
ncbi:MAG: IS200/IS605 family transposase [Microcoleaceae cyanobacterium]